MIFWPFSWIRHKKIFFVFMLIISDYIAKPCFLLISGGQLGFFINGVCRVVWPEIVLDIALWVK